jgi:spore germination protein KB
MVAIFAISRMMVDYSYMPSVCMLPATQDAWIVDILAGVFIFIFCIPALYLLNKFKGMSLIQYTEKVTGKIGGKIIGIYYILYFLFLCSAVTLFMVDFLKSSIFHETPLYVLTLFILVPCMYSAYKGVEAIGRSAVILGIFVFGSIIIFTICNINNMDFSTLLPIYADTGFKNLAKGVYEVGGRFCDSAVFYMFAPYLAKKESITKALAITITIFTAFYVIIAISTQTVLGVELAKNLNYPYFIAVQQINLFEFIQRIEFISVIVWIVIFYTKVSTTFYAGALIASQIFRTKSYKPFILPMNIVVFAVLLFIPLRNNPILRIVGESYYYLFALFLSMFIIPFIVLIVYFFRRKKLSDQLPEV